MVSPYYKLKATGKKASPTKQWCFTLLLPHVDKLLKGRHRSHTLYQHIATANYSCSVKLVWKIQSQYFSKATWVSWVFGRYIFPPWQKRTKRSVSGESKAQIKQQQHILAIIQCAHYFKFLSVRSYINKNGQFLSGGVGFSNNIKMKCGSVTFSECI